MTSNIVAQLQAFDPVNGDAREFDSLLAESFAGLPKEEAALALLGLLEQHPEEDGTAYWGIVHGLEANGGYEDKLRESILKTPSFFGVLLANRMFNAGEGTDWIPDSFREILSSGRTTPRVRKSVESFITRIQINQAEQADAGNRAKPGA